MPFVPPLTQIVPPRIHRNNQLDLLNPKPAFDPLLPVNRVAHIIKALVVNEPFDFVTLAECRSVPKLVFPNAAVKVVCNSNVKRLGAICQDINAVTAVRLKVEENQLVGIFGKIGVLVDGLKGA
jgi:hypothetical protein